MTRRVCWLFFALVVATAACSSSSSTSTSTSTHALPTTTATAPLATTTTTTTASCDRPHAAGQTSETLNFDGQARTYQLYVPKKYDGRTDVPVVFDFHGFGSNAVQQMVYGNFKPEADQDDFIIVAPDGQQSAAGRHFNLTGEKGLQNDVTMVGSLLDHIEQAFCVDTKRVYATGMSDGGAMSSVLACTDFNRFAAFAPVAVIIYQTSCGGTHPIALMGFQGTADPIVPFNGGKVNCCGGATVAGSPVSMAGWAAHDGCSKTFTDTRVSSEVRKRTWSGCKEGDVVFYIIDGGGHTWPGSIPIASLGMTTKQLDASQTIWNFFKQHTLS